MVNLVSSVGLKHWRFLKMIQEESGERIISVEYSAKGRDPPERGDENGKRI